MRTKSHTIFLLSSIFVIACSKESKDEVDLEQQRLIKRSFERNNEIYDAIVHRGFEYEQPNNDDSISIHIEIPIESFPDGFKDYDTFTLIPGADSSGRLIFHIVPKTKKSK